MNRVGAVLSAVAAFAVCACGSRPAYWDQPAPGFDVSTYGMTQGVALVDLGNDRAAFLSALADQHLSSQTLRLPHNVVATEVSPDQKSLFFLAAGDWPRQSPSDQLPSLTWIAPTSQTLAAGVPNMAAAQFWMSQPLQNLAIDPQEHWAVAYAGAQTNFVQNPNELVLFDLTQPPNPLTASASLDPNRAPNPTARTIQAFGGVPNQLIFTGPLAVGGQMRHLLLVETDIDVTLLDLDSAFPVPPATAPPETTVRLTSGADATTVTPAGIVVYAGDANGPARIAIRAANDSNIFTLVLGSSAPTINLTDVGGIPSDIAFVKTDATTNGGLRVAALVPANMNAVLIDPDTSLTTIVALGAPYSRLSLVTQALGSASLNVDVALLWGAAAGTTTFEAALWTLVDTVNMPYRSVEGVSVSQDIQAVDDVPGNPQLKVLQVTHGNEFVVLNLSNQNAAPLNTTQSASMIIAPDGGRMWVFAQGQTDLAAIDFSNLNPIRLSTDLPIDAVYDVARVGSSAAAPQRSLIAIHKQGSIGATVFDALKPDPTTSRRADGLLLGAP